MLETFTNQACRNQADTMPVSPLLTQTKSFGEYAN